MDVVASQVNLCLMPPLLTVAGFKAPVAGASTAVGTVAASANASPVETQMIQFYTPYGKHLRTLKVPGTQLAALTWEGTGVSLSVPMCLRLSA